MKWSQTKFELNQTDTNSFNRFQFWFQKFWLKPNSLVSSLGKNGLNQTKPNFPNTSMHRKTTAALASEAQQWKRSDDEPGVSVSDMVILKVPACVVWDKYPMRMERLLDYLDAHLDVTIKLFGDSIQAAKSEGWSKLMVKSSKTTAYLQVADGVFSIDDDVAIQNDFATNLNKYVKAIDNYITL